ncbi:MAG: hypothetical protein K0R71_1229 [Bacillales bacterium]|jgi:aspartate carbamoyltransferase regulatory subunit|nr:hypothetical protein [Bacillales bacterium]
MLTVTSIKKGIVIDHITAGLGFRLMKYLKLNKASFPVALISNVPSKKYEKKDIIKIQDLIEFDLAKIGLIDPNITISFIDGGRTIRKVNVQLPNKVEDVIICKNPRCITSIEKNVSHKFELVDGKTKTYKCCYCEDFQKEITI